MKKKISKIPTIIIGDFEIGFDGEYPITLISKTLLLPQQLLELETEMSNQLNMPVFIPCLLSKDEKKGKHTYRMIHTDSVICHKERSSYPTSLTDDFKVVGLWNGKSVFDLKLLFDELARKEPEHFFYDGLASLWPVAMRSHRIHSATLRKHKIPVIDLYRSIPFFIDDQNQAIMFIGIYRSRYMLAITADTESLYELLQNIKGYWNIPHKVDWPLFPKVQFIKNTEDIVSDFNDVKRMNYIEKNKAAAQVRDFLRKFYDWSFTVTGSQWFDDVGLSILDSHKMIHSHYQSNNIEIQEQAKREFYYVKESDFPDYFSYTEKGAQIAIKKMLPRMNRKQIDKLLDTVVSRCVEAEKIPELLVRVEQIYVFGSYLDKEKTDFGDLDLFYVINRRATIDPKLLPQGDDALRYNLPKIACYKSREICLNAYHEGRLVSPPQIKEFSLYFDFDMLLKQLKRSNNHISMHLLDELKELNRVPEILKVYDFSSNEPTKRVLYKAKEVLRTE